MQIANEVIQRELDPTNLIDTDQDLMLEFLKNGQTQLYIKDEIKGLRRLIKSEQFEKHAPQEVKQLATTILNSFLELKKLIVVKGELLNSGQSLIDLCNKFIELIDVKDFSQIEQSIVDLSVEIAAFEQKLNLSQKQLPYVNYTKLQPGHSYPLFLESEPDQEQCYEVTISNYWLFLRHRAEAGDLAVAYEIEEPSLKPIGEGAFATVTELKGKLSYDYPCLRFREYGRVSDIHTDDDIYALKSTLDTANDPDKSPEKGPDIISKEWDITQHIPHMHAKRPNIGSKHGRMVMKYIPEIDLYNYLEGKNLVLPASFIPDIFVKLLRAYKSQLYDNNVIHRDLKTENIRLTIKESAAGQAIPSQFTVIDFNLSQLKGKPRFETSGTPFLLPPEIFQKRAQTAASDIYTLGLIFIEIICNNSYRERCARIFIAMAKKVQSYFETNIPNLAELEKVLTTHRKSLENLAKEGLQKSGLPLQIQNKILRQIRFMIGINPDGRPKIDTLIDSFEHIHSSYLLKKDDTEEEDNHLKEVIEGLHQIELDTEHKNLLPKRPDNLASLRDTLINGCSTIKEGEPLKVFLSRLGIASLENIDTHDALSLHVDTIINNFVEKMDQLTKLDLLIAELQLNNCIEDKTEISLIETELARVFNKHHKYPVTLNNLVSLTVRVERRLDGLKEKITWLKTLPNVTKGIDLETNFGPQIKAQHTALREKLYAVIESYVIKSDTSYNHFFARHAFSPIRKAEINKIIDILNDNYLPETILAKVQDVVKAIDSGFFPFSKSTLKDNLQKVIDEFQIPLAENHPEGLVS
ncbi:MAG: protein kinase [Gammaproteobacteria bacterium]|nr:protein kinase [Gammaproteobacteria bacterium]